MRGLYWVLSILVFGMRFVAFPVTLWIHWSWGNLGRLVFAWGACTFLCAVGRIEYVAPLLQRQIPVTVKQSLLVWEAGVSLVLYVVGLVVAWGVIQ